MGLLASCVETVYSLSSGPACCSETIFVTILLRTRAGFPATTWNGGTSCQRLLLVMRILIALYYSNLHTLVTTLPAPIVQPVPIVIPGSTIALPPNQQSSPMWISPPSSGPCVPFRMTGSNGWVPLKKDTLGPMSVRAPIVTKQVSRMVQLKLMKTPEPTRVWVP